MKDNESQETRIALLENNHQTMMDKILEFQKENKEQHLELKDMIIEALDKKADKIDVERMRNFLLWAGGIIGTGILGYVGLQLIKIIEHV